MGDQVYITGPGLKTRYGGITAKTIHEWRNHKGFPAPHHITGNLNFWLLADVEAWDEAERAADAKRRERRQEITRMGLAARQANRAA